MLRRLLFSWQAYPEQGGAILQCQGCNCSNYFLFLNIRICGQEGEERQSSSSLQCQIFLVLAKSPTRPCSTLPRLTSSSLVSALISRFQFWFLSSGFHLVGLLPVGLVLKNIASISGAQGQVLKNLLPSLNPSVILLSIMDEG